MSRVYEAADNVLLLEDYEKHGPADLTGWRMSEKLDGVRAVWNGKFFETRSGRLDMKYPDYYKEIMPTDIALDGEIWLERGVFDDHGFLRNQKSFDPKKWKNAKFMVFDMPSSKEKFKNRYKLIKTAIQGVREKFEKLQKSDKDVFPEKCPVRRLRHRKIKSTKQAKEYFEEVVKGGGEGLVLRDPNAFYEGKRCKHSLKMKPKPEVEGIIIGYQEGTNKNVGKLGAFVMHPLKSSDSLDNKRIDFSVKFEIGTGLTDIVRGSCTFKKGVGSSKEYPIGTIVTYRYQNLTKTGKPRFPSFIRKRNDMTIHSSDLKKLGL